MQIAEERGKRTGAAGAGSTVPQAALFSDGFPQPPAKVFPSSCANLSTEVLASRGLWSLVLESVPLLQAKSLAAARSIGVKLVQHQLRRSFFCRTQTAVNLPAPEQHQLSDTFCGLVVSGVAHRAPGIPVPGPILWAELAACSGVGTSGRWAMGWWAGGDGSHQRKSRVLQLGLLLGVCSGTQMHHAGGSCFANSQAPWGGGGTSEGWARGSAETEV